jgi:tetratricopeptide (TPR) repeat protein
MLALPALSQAAWAETPKAATSEDAALAKYERIMFGHHKQVGSPTERLDAIEGSLFGKRQKGTTDQRLQAIGKMLEPQVHHAHSSASSAPPIAPPHSANHTAHEVTNVSTNSQKHVEHAQHETASSGNSATMQKGHVSIMEEKGDNVTGLMDKAMKAYQTGNNIEAARLFNQVTIIDNQNADAHFNLGVLAERNGNLPQALARYKAALALNPQEGEYQSAVEATERNLQASTTFNQTRLSRATQPQNTSAILPVSTPSITREKRHSSMGRVLGTCAAVGLGIAGSAGGVDIACPVCRILRLH